MRMAGRDLLTLPPVMMLDVIYCIALEDSKDGIDRRADLDAKLEASATPDRATWGRTPAQQRAMAAATAIRV